MRIQKNAARSEIANVEPGTNATEWSPLPHNPWVEESLEVTGGRLSPLRARRCLIIIVMMMVVDYNYIVHSNE